MSNLKIGIFVAAFIAIFVVGLIINPFVIIGAGQRGVVLNWGAVSDIILGEGIHWRIPIQQEVKHINVRTVKMEVPAAAYSKDIQTVDSKIALNYHILPDKANRVYQTLGSDFENSEVGKLMPSVMESAKKIEVKEYAKSEVLATESQREALPPRTPVEERQEQ
jgi:regulator of protease activity HflC (stomatin/prohibitin superfamily)